MPFFGAMSPICHVSFRIARLYSEQNLSKAFGRHIHKKVATTLQGKAGQMDDLVLHAIANLPPQPHDNIHRALTANPVPQQTLAQQRAAVMF